jgi:hypothetical protein
MKNIVSTIVALLLIFVGFTSCKKEICNTKKVNHQVEYLTITKGELHGNGQEGFNMQGLVINSQAEYDNLLNKMSDVNNIKKDISDTIIDFSQFQVIAVFSDVKTTGGHSISIKSITDNNTFCCVNIEEISNNIGADVPIMTQPYHLVKISKTNKNIFFNW